ncbi:hypothetical protein [Mycetocola zhadangensis]|uniref:Uncharacterized protein n=1 Tax=Mycetocola zhadangensis TaxID=1164595 RepID=A0A3L7J143_9MICO|nr:hypothetical protein [Mycetocola zhadangensis]RLQ84190.1 hypothetical protein D9V28_08180 [Mycetocola zhadangensis]
MKKQAALIEEVLVSFFGKEHDASTGIRQKRIEQVDKLLRRYLETEATTFLTTPELALVEAEREFNPKAAVVRTVQAEALLFGLKSFVEPPYLDPDPLLRRVQLQCVEKLAWRLITTELRGEDTGCVEIDLDCALRRAKDELTRERREKTSARRRALLDEEIQARIATLPQIPRQVEP